MPSITQFSLDTSRLSIMFLVGIAALGIYRFLDYPKQEDPSIVIREAVVTANFQGMSHTAS